MPTFPTTPTPYSCSPFGIIDPVLKMETDQGYTVRRSRWSRSKRVYEVTYFHNADDLHLITDFIERQTRGGALSFDWTYPYGMSIASINTATPNLLTTDYNHGLQTADQVTIAGSSTHNGTYTIIRVAAKTFSLNGTAGGVADTAGTVALHLPYASFIFDGDRMPIPDLVHDMGPLRDNEGLFTLRLRIQEEFA